LIPKKSVINYIVFEYCSRNTLFDYLCQKPLSLNASVFYFRQLVEAMLFMHRTRVCHRDLKPENLLIDANFDLRLADYGFAAKLDNKALLYSCKGTLNYMSPEILNYEYAERHGYNGELGDVFALGVIFFAMLMGRPPFKQADPKTDPHFKLLYFQQFGQFWRIWETQYAHPQGIVIPEGFKTLLTSLLQYRPALRLSLNEIS
jgi:serine/threonine protein kinase